MPERKRVCSYCGELTDFEYSDEAWRARGEQCEQCENEELLVLDII
ncbi:MAG: hypothetical protein LUO88_01875 [Methanoregulaceae archaeon]|nr:hypothetical protein [Methanoregulaceae archaeon]